MESTETFTPEISSDETGTSIVTETDPAGGEMPEDKSDPSPQHSTPMRPQSISPKRSLEDDDVPDVEPQQKQMKFKRRNAALYTSPQEKDEA